MDLADFYRHLRYGKQSGYRVLFQNQPERAVGKTGILIAEMGLPEEYEFSFYNHFMAHVFSYVMPPVIRSLALGDHGFALIDPENPLARKAFKPRQLVDAWGSQTTRRGTPYTRCELVWKPANPKNPWDHGYFLFRGDGPSGYADLCEKVGARVCGWYYGKLLPDRNISWRSQMRAIYAEAVQELSRRYPQAEFRSAFYMEPDSLRQAVDELVAAGCQAIVYQSINCPLYSDFEDYGYTLPLIHRFAAGRARVIMADQPGNQAAYREAYLQMLCDQLINLTPAASVLVILSCHGHPFKHETMDERAALYRGPLESGVREVMAGRRGKWDLVWSFDEYADEYWNPQQTKLETYAAYRKAISAGYDYAIELPTEFPAENSDLMIFHAMKKFRAFRDYDRNQPVHYPDWEAPLVRAFHEGRTTGIYAGAPVGPYRKYVVRAVVESIRGRMNVEG